MATEPSFFFLLLNIKVKQRKIPAANCGRDLNICTGWELHMLVYLVLNLVTVANCLLNELANYVRVVKEVK